MLVPILCVEDERHGMAWERLLVLRLVVVVCVMCGLDRAIACQRVLEAASRCRKNPEMKSRELRSDSSSGVVGDIVWVVRDVGTDRETEAQQDVPKHWREGPGGTDRGTDPKRDSPKQAQCATKRRQNQGRRTICTARYVCMCVCI